MEIKREAGQVVPPPFLSPLGESGQSDGGRLAGRVLACLYNPGNLKKVPEKPKKVTKITGGNQRRPSPAATPMPRPSHLSPDNILRFLQVRSAPASPSEIAEGLHLKKSDLGALFKMLSKLKKRRAIEELPGGRYGLANRKSERAGPREAIEDAMHGDRVLAKIQRLGGVTGAQRAEGHITRILGRAHPTVVGLFRYGSQQNVVLPYDVRIQHQVEIPRGKELTPGLWKKLGFSGADETSMASRRIPRLEELDGAVVNVELLRYPQGGAPATGRVIEILGRPGDLGVDTEIIIRKHHLPHAFSAEVRDEAERGAKPVSATERAGREDFRHLPIVTIDGETARDFDDAVF